jgi:hypothetical protein
MVGDYMELEDLIKPLNRLADECFFNESLKDFVYLFEDFAEHFAQYSIRKDADSFTLLSMDELACIDRFSERNDFMRDSLMVIMDVMEAVKIDYLNHDNNEDDSARKNLLLSGAVKEIERLVNQDAKDEEDLGYKN